MAVKYHCGTCKIRIYAERKSDSVFSWFLQLHTKLCPKWKGYRRELVERLRLLTQDHLTAD
jgi:hypothetical protein